MEEQYVDENFEIQTRTKDETQIELEKVIYSFICLTFRASSFGTSGLSLCP